MEEIWRNARELRNTATDAERHLWKFLRRRQLDGLKFRRQYPIAGRVVYDAERTRKMQANGYRVLRFWNHDVLAQTDAVLDEIIRTLADD